MGRRATCVLLSAVASVAHAADSSQPHFHSGKLTPYRIGPPSVLLSSKDEDRLRSGHPVVQTLVSEDGVSRRMIMVADIPVPSSIVLGRIMDLNNYDRMVSGVDRCVTYASNQAGGVQTVRSAYEISALHMKLKYYVEHTYDPSQNCMTFRLDYSRRSDLDDTVGYWYVDSTGRASSRVFYSCECKLRGWVPGPVYAMLTKEAIKKATVWVSDESIKEWRRSRQSDPREAMAQFVGHVRQSLDNLKVPQLPEALTLPRWMEGRKDAAVRFVSARQVLRGRRRPAELSTHEDA